MPIELKDDIELAIDSYVDDMNQELYETISSGRIDFLRNLGRISVPLFMIVSDLITNMTIQEFLINIINYWCKYTDNKRIIAIFAVRFKCFYY